MRLLHPQTIKIVSQHPEFPKTIISHCWSEVFKWLGSKKSHPKMFIDDPFDLGVYIRTVFHYGIMHGCKLDVGKIANLPDKVQRGWNTHTIHYLNKYFDDNYLFSDACSLYYKGINIFPDIFGDQWRKYVPVESHSEIIRQCQKTVDK